MRGEIVIRPPIKAGNGAAVYVPKRWLGWVIRCEVVRKAPLKHETPKTGSNGGGAEGENGKV